MYDAFRPSERRKANARLAVDDTNKLDLGDELQLTVVRGDEHLDVPVAVRLIPDASQVGLGILVATVNQQIQLSLPVDVTPNVSVGGPSAGLMMALTVYDLLDPTDLTGKRVIAGTGAIDLSGAVRPVGGIRQKVRGAQLAGATIFLHLNSSLRKRVASPSLI